MIEKVCSWTLFEAPVAQHAVGLARKVTPYQLRSKLIGGGATWPGMRARSARAPPWACLKTKFAVWMPRPASGESANDVAAQSALRDRAPTDWTDAGIAGNGGPTVRTELRGGFRFASKTIPEGLGLLDRPVKCVFGFSSLFSISE